MKPEARQAGRGGACAGLGAEIGPLAGSWAGHAPKRRPGPARRPVIEDRLDRRRGCGWRKAGGLYLVAEGLARPCGRLPIPLDVCPTCGGGVRPSRGWTWVNGTALAATRPCDRPGCSTCPLGGPIGRCGLLWVGGMFYPTPAAFEREAARQGVCRRIAAIPRDLAIGRTWVMLAHRAGIRNPDGSQSAAVFRLFRPRAIEYAVRGDEPAERLAALAARGVTLVRVRRIGDLPLLPAHAQPAGGPDLAPGAADGPAT